MKILLEIVEEKAIFVKTQQPRLHTLWNNYWSNTPLQLPQMKNIILDKTQFLENINNRAQTLRTLQHAMKEGYDLVRTIIHYFFLEYIEKDTIAKDFDSDIIMDVKFMIAEDLLGTLLNFVIMDQTPVSLEYILIAKFKSLLMIRPLTTERIQSDLQRVNISLSIDLIENSIDNLIQWGYIEKLKDPKSGQDAYKFIKKFDLDLESQKQYNQKLKQVIEWTIGLWRTLYNIRSIDTPIPESYPMQDSLQDIVSRAATQGFTHAHNVITNLADYFDYIVENNIQCP